MPRRGTRQLSRGYIMERQQTTALPQGIGGGHCYPNSSLDGACNYFVVLKLLSKVLRSAGPLKNWMLGRQMRIYLFKPETIAFGVLLLVFFTYLNWLQNKWCKPLWSRAHKAIGGLRFPLLEGGGIIGNEAAAAARSWQLRSDNVGVYAVQGRRAKMEDRFSVAIDDPPLHCSLYGIFDGHGGESAAEFVKKTLFNSFLERMKKEQQHANIQGDNGAPTKHWDFAQILSEEILALDKQLLKMAKAAKDLAGTTALVALVHQEKLVVANVGDSRGVICDGRGMAIPLSFDHKPHQLKEQKRIKQAGGFVAFNGVWRVAGILATSRALGDYPLKDRNLVIADPDVLTFDLRDLKPRFMILASDGLWDTFSNEEAVAFVGKRLSEPDFGAKSLAMQAYQRGSLDNITVLVVTFQKSASSA